MARGLPLLLVVGMGRRVSLAQPAVTADQQSGQATAGQPTAGHAERVEHSTNSAARPSLAAASERSVRPSVRPSVRIDGYVEAHYTYSFNRPRNAVIAHRAFDNRHATFALSNAVVALSADETLAYGRLALQVGVTPATYYQAEPTLPAAGGAAPVDAGLWRHIQEAYGGVRPPWLPALSFEMGVFLSQIGFEPMAIREAWNWSRSNLFFGLPFYHTGARLNYALSSNWIMTAALFNGWNSVMDNNTDKSISLRIHHKRSSWEAAVLYFGGVERSADDEQGQPWRHLVDAWAKGAVGTRFDIAAQVNAGIESTSARATSWSAAALHARFHASKNLDFATRTDVFWEQAPTAANGERASIFWDCERILSQTLTLSWWMHARIRWMLEYRHDAASGPIYFKGSQATPGTRRQNTTTAGLVFSF